MVVVVVVVVVVIGVSGITIVTTTGGVLLFEGAAGVDVARLLKERKIINQENGKRTE